MNLSLIFYDIRSDLARFAHRFQKDSDVYVYFIYLVMYYDENGGCSSKAAIASIVSLQKRIKLLEDENSILEEKYKSLKKQLTTQEDAFNKREESMRQAKLNAKMKLDEINEALKEIKIERAENKNLKDNMDQMDMILQNQTQKNKKEKKLNTRLNKSLSEVSNKINEYENLLAEILKPPSISTHLNDNEVALISSGNIDMNSLPEPLAIILDKLQSLPKLYYRQDFETKKETIAVLYNAKRLATSLRTKMSHMERRKFSSSTPKKYDEHIHKLAINLLILSNEMKKFKIFQA